MKWLCPPTGLVADLWTLKGSTTEVDEGAVAWIALDLPGAVPAPRKGAAVACELCQMALPALSQPPTPP
jgi:hypothetical protein